MPDFHKLREEAKKNAHKYHPEQEGRTDDSFTFAEIGTYIPSEAIKEQLRRLEEIQREADETVFPPWVRF
jgi:hypothetical protein